MEEEAGEDDELFIVDENGETQLSGYVGPDFENNLRVPLLEILKYPYLLLHEKVSMYLVAYSWKAWCCLYCRRFKKKKNWLNQSTFFFFNQVVEFVFCYVSL